jgi:hypothetical protein
MTHIAHTFSSRRDGLVVEELGAELLIYDRRTDVAHCLGDVAAVTWRAFEDGATVDHAAGRILASGLASSLEEARTLAGTAVAELEERDLLERQETSGFISERVPRRQALRRMAGVGMAAATGPLVLSVAVPSAWAGMSAAGVCSPGQIYVSWTNTSGTYLAMISSSSGSSGNPDYTIVSCNEITSTQLPPPANGIQSADYGITQTDSGMCGDLRMKVDGSTYYIGTATGSKAGWSTSGNVGASFIACKNPQGSGTTCIYGSSASQDPPGEHTSTFGKTVAGEVLVFTCPPTTIPGGNCVMNTYACSTDDQCCSSNCSGGVCS